MIDRLAYQGITFDDVLLEPGYSEAGRVGRGCDSERGRGRGRWFGSGVGHGHVGELRL